MPTLPPEQTIIRRIVARVHNPLVQSWLRIVVEQRGEVDVAQLIEILTGEHNIRQVYAALRVQTIAGLFELDLRPILLKAVQSSGEPALRAFSEAHGFGQLHLDTFVTEAVGAVDGVVAVAIKRIKAGGFTAVREQVARGFEAGRSPAQIARSLVDSIGLDARRAEEWERWLAKLADNSPDLTEKQLQALIDKEYRKRLRARADVIARTEIANASGEAQELIWRRAVKEGQLNPDAYVRVWRRLARQKFCKICSPLDHQRARLIRGYFVGADGKRYTRTPGHPNCLCGVALERWRAGDEKLPQLPAA